MGVYVELYLFIPLGRHRLTQTSDYYTQCYNDTHHGRL